MAHFAHVENGTVIEVIVVNNDILDPADEEGSGQAFLASLYPGTVPADFVQTSYSAARRGRYAGIGDLWDGNTFAEPPHPIDDVVQKAYERGKADGSAETLTAMAAAPSVESL